MSGHVDDLLPLEAAGALGPEDAERVAAHVESCEACASAARRWRTLAAALRDLDSPAPSPRLLARTRERVERRRAEREEETWNRAALGFLIVFGWTLTGVVWLLLELVLGELALRSEQPVGSTLVWFVTYLVAGWVTAAAAALLLGRQAREEGRLA